MEKEDPKIAFALYEAALELLKYNTMLAEWKLFEGYRLC